jgi:hypothetical protein
MGSTFLSLGSLRVGNARRSASKNAVRRTGALPTRPTWCNRVGKLRACAIVIMATPGNFAHPTDRFHQDPPAVFNPSRHRILPPSSNRAELLPRLALNQGK